MWQMLDLAEAMKMVEFSMNGAESRKVRASVTGSERSSRGPIPECRRHDNADTSHCQVIYYTFEGTDWAQGRLVGLGVRGCHAGVRFLRARSGSLDPSVAAA